MATASKTTLRRRKKEDDELGEIDTGDLRPIRSARSTKPKSSRTKPSSRRSVKVKPKRKKVARKNTASVVAAALGIDKKLVSKILDVAEWMRKFGKQITK